MPRLFRVALLLLAVVASSLPASGRAEAETQAALVQAGAHLGCNDNGDVTAVWLFGPDVPSELLEQLQNLNELEELLLNGVPVADRDLKTVARLRKLTQLSLVATNITDDGLSALQPLRALKDLTLTGMQSSGLTPEVVGLSPEQIRDYRRFQIKGPGLAVLKLLPNLEALRLGYYPIGDDALEHVRKLVNLKVLELSGTKITDEGLSQLNTLRNLQYLSLRDTQVSGKGLRHLAGFPKLEGLDIGGCTLTPADIEHFRSLEKLRVLIVDPARLGSVKMTDLREALPYLFTGIAVTLLRGVAAVRLTSSWTGRSHRETARSASGCGAGSPSWRPSSRG